MDGGGGVSKGHPMARERAEQEQRMTDSSKKMAFCC